MIAIAPGVCYNFLIKILNRGGTTAKWTWTKNFTA